MKTSLVRLFVVPLLTSVFILSTAAPARCQMLRTIGNEVRHGVPSRDDDDEKDDDDDDDRSCSHSHYHGDDDDHINAGWLFYPIAAGLTAPFWGPYFLCGDDFAVGHVFPDYPYQHEGYLMPASGCYRSIHDGRLEECPEKWLGGRMTVKYGTNFGGLEQVGGDLLFTTKSRFGFDTEGHWLREDLAVGHDELALGDFNINFRFAQNPRACFYAGLGANWLEYGGHVDSGFNFTYGADVFLKDPVVWSTWMDLGKVGDASLFRLRTTVGYSVNRFEPFIGYEYLDIGTTEINQMVAGVRMWF